MRGPAVLMEELMLGKEERKVASLAATREAETADNGRMKASAPEVKTVHGRFPILKKRKEVDPRVLAKNPRRPNLWHDCTQGLLMEVEFGFVDKLHWLSFGEI